MKGLSILALVFLMVSCGKDKKQSPAIPSSENLKQRATDINSVEVAPISAEDKISTENIKKYLGSLGKKEVPVAHCVMDLDTGKGTTIKSHSIFSYERKSKLIGKRRKFIIHERRVKKDMTTTLFHKEHEFKINRKTKVNEGDFDLEYADNNELKGLKLVLADEDKTVLIPFLRVQGSMQSSTACTML